MTIDDICSWGSSTKEYDIMAVMRGGGWKEIYYSKTCTPKKKSEDYFFFASILGRTPWINVHLGNEQTIYNFFSALYLFT